MLTEGNCLIFRKCKELRDMMEDMDRYQGTRISRDWFVECEEIINEQGIIYIQVLRDSFMYSRIRPCDIERCIEVNPRKNNKRWL